MCRISIHTYTYPDGHHRERHEYTSCVDYLQGSNCETEYYYEQITLSNLCHYREQPDRQFNGSADDNRCLGTHNNNRVVTDSEGSTNSTSFVDSVQEHRRQRLRKQTHYHEKRRVRRDVANEYFHPIDQVGTETAHHSRNYRFPTSTKSVSFADGDNMIRFNAAEPPAKLRAKAL